MAFDVLEMIEDHVFVALPDQVEKTRQGTQRDWTIEMRAPSRSKLC
jgi:hypothetical protein